MPNPDKPMPEAYAQERKYRRFNLRYPVRLKFSSGTLASELDAMSRNVSLGGMLLETASAIPERTAVSFVMTLGGGRIARPIELTGDGHVVRVESSQAPSAYAIAVQCEHPITQIEPYLA
jgi:PilZ domain